MLGPGVGGPSAGSGGWRLGLRAGTGVGVGARVWRLGLGRVWDWRPGLGLGLAHSVKSNHEDLDSILRTYVRQAGHDGAVITPTLEGAE